MSRFVVCIGVVMLVALAIVAGIRIAEGDAPNFAMCAILFGTIGAQVAHELERMRTRRR